MSRPAKVVIDLDALRFNYRYAKQVTGRKIAAAVKANAYGHGIVHVAQALAAEADAFAVACIEEAVELRAAGIKTPILLLEGFFEASEIPLIDELQLDTVVQHPFQIEALQQASVSRPIRVWLKMDSGMHRVGFLPDQYRAAWHQLNDTAAVREIILMTHFARADEPEHGYTRSQVETFNESILGLSGSRSLCNSAGLLAWSEAHGDWGRPGLMLYGVSPFVGHHPAADPLRPVMKLTSGLIAVRDIPQGVPVGYGGSWVAPRQTRAGVVAMGYGDGYPRHAPSGTPVLINGHRAPVIGRISMDMMTVDLTDVPDVAIGDEVTLWGDPLLSATEVADMAATIPYELFCSVKRVPFSYESKAVSVSETDLQDTAV
ncbi:alanine racemase [Spongorhabdus nitratireducens]